MTSSPDTNSPFAIAQMEQMSVGQLANVLRLQCAITEADASGQTYFAAGLRSLLAQQMRFHPMHRISVQASGCDAQPATGRN